MTHDRPMTETNEQDRLNTENLRDFSTLRRSMTDRKIAGVAGGLGRHLNIDPTIVRVLFVVLCFFGGAGFLLYGAAWLLVPEEGKDEAAIGTSSATRNALLVTAGVVAALLIIGDSWGGFWFPWPLAVIALVVYLVLMNRDRAMNSQTRPPGQWTAGQPAGEDAPVSGGVAPGDTATLPPGEPASPTPPWTPPTQQGYQPPAPKPDRGPKLFWITLALVAIALGSLGLYEVAGGAVVDAAYPALALTVVGVMLVVGAWVGRAGGLIFLGIVAAVSLAVTSTVDPRFDGDREIDALPTTALQVKDSYSVPAGSIHVDLSNIRDIERLDGREINVDANAGEIVVTLPEGVDVDVRAEVSIAGEARVLDDDRNGTDVLIERQIDGGVDAPEIELDLELLVGSIEVRQP